MDSSIVCCDGAFGMKSIVTTTKLNSFHNFIFVSVCDFLFFFILFVFHHPHYRCLCFWHDQSCRTRLAGVASSQWWLFVVISIQSCTRFGFGWTMLRCHANDNVRDQNDTLCYWKLFIVPTIFVDWTEFARARLRTPRYVVKMAEHLKLSLHLAYV